MGKTYYGGKVFPQQYQRSVEDRIIQQSGPQIIRSEEVRQEMAQQHQRQNQSSRSPERKLSPRITEKKQKRFVSRSLKNLKSIQTKLKKLREIYKNEKKEHKRDLNNLKEEGKIQLHRNRAQIQIQQERIQINYEEISRTSKKVLELQQKANIANVHCQQLYLQEKERERHLEYLNQEIDRREQWLNLHKQSYEYQNEEEEGEEDEDEDEDKFRGQGLVQQNRYQLDYSDPEPGDILPPQSPSPSQSP